jgi:hypothetical protein
MRVLKREYRSRLVAFALALLMVLTMLPLAGAGKAAYAEPDEAAEVTTEESAVAVDAQPEEPRELAGSMAEPQPPVEEATGGLATLATPFATFHALTSGITGDVGAGSLTLSTQSAEAGTTITVSATPATGYYLAQVRYSEDGGTTYTALEPQNNSYSFIMPDAAVDVQADFVSIVWDGTIDVTWFDPAADVYTLYYPAQYEGLAAIVNGLFTL